MQVYMVLPHHYKMPTSMGAHQVCFLAETPLIVYNHDTHACTNYWMCMSIVTLSSIIIYVHESPLSLYILQSNINN